ncbi:tyrosyl-DNA phosphodiesterase 1-like [Diadema antillarum]|uniref:tyrosyl-DNA phosphodiesterase 1-like n=1 Tax=Diadema antillarum TaxID=105358 RepID=UPI003A8A8B81
MAMARALAAGHDISDSDSDGEEKLPLRKLVSKSSFVSEHSVSDSDSDATYIEEEEEEDRDRNSNDNHPKRAKSKRKHPTDSDSDVSDDEPSTSSRIRGKIRGSENENSSSPKRLKRDDTVLLDEGESSASSKPECQYGKQCYRKNPSHLREFKHAGKDGNSSTQRQKKSSSGARTSPLSCPEVVERVSPYGFALTKVHGIDDIYNNTCAVHIRDILHPCMGQLVASAHFNYMFDIPWLMKQYPREFRDKSILLVHGEQREGKVALHKAAKPYPNVNLCQAKLEIMYGTHHSKMMFLLYTNGMRVVIHTANIIDIDWHQKTQGVWISPLFPKLPSGKQGSGRGESATFFKRDLLAYLTAYKAPSLQEWKTHVSEHDMSQAKVHIVASVPGRHLGEAKDKWGHLRVRKLLRQYGPSDKSVSGWPVIGQFSSIGSLGPEKSKWLCAEWFQSMSSAKGQVGSHVLDVNTKHMKLIFPCSDNVRTSLEGYPAGGSLPYSIQTAKKQLYLHSFFHQWKASEMGRSRASPHIKTYTRLSPDNQKIAWFMVTSANLSKAAWGALEKNGSQLMIRSYEIGVMMLPSNFSKTREAFPLSGDRSEKECPNFPLPWDAPLTPYGSGDRPWIWDIPYTDKPDTNGNAWVPGRR